MQWGRDTGTVFDAQAESYACRYEAYLTDYRVEPRKLLWGPRAQGEARRPSFGDGNGRQPQNLLV